MEQQDWILDRSRAWRDQARALRLQIQDRFRVAVDRHRDRRSHRTPTLERWIRRARCFLRDPASSRIDSISSRFYKKPVNKDVDKTDNTVIIRLLQALAVPVLGNACHIFMHGLNRIEIYGAEKLHEALLRRPKGKPLLTVSNHVAAIDDPFVIASLLPPSVMLDSRNIRWTLCATDRCFTNPMLSAFFRCVKVLPVSRGDGVYQKGMDMALSKLNGGGWVHIFPEGSRSRDGGRTIRSAKRGVGRLVMDADNIPIVIPFVHAGMQEIMPVGTHFPKIGKRVTVLVGDPINFEDLLASGDYSDTQVSRGILYDNISSIINCQLRELKHQVDRLVLEQALESQDRHLSNVERANEIWQQVDWEAFGLLSGEEYTPSSKPLVPIQSSSYSDSHYRRSNSHSTIRVGLSYEGGIVSRIRGYMNPNELMGFAARGLSFEYSNPRTNLLEVSKQISFEFQDVQPLKVWKQFLEANILQKLNM